MKNKKKCRFINLAEAMHVQNDMVSSTMDSILHFVSNSESVELRSDFGQIQQTVRQMSKLNPAGEARENGNGGMPRPKLTSRNQNSRPIQGNS